MAIDTLNPTSNRETAALAPADSPRRDAYSVLDHRARRRAVPGGQAGPGHHLAIEDVTGGQHFVPLDRSITHIGRGSGADLVLEDAGISRRHAILVVDGNRARILDDRSTHGTFVNGVRAASSDLHDGDVIRLGQIAITYVVVH